MANETKTKILSYYSFENRGFTRRRFRSVGIVNDVNAFVFEKDADQWGDNAGVWIQVDDDTVIAARIRLFNWKEHQQHLPESLDAWKEALRSRYAKLFDDGDVLAGEAVLVGFSDQQIAESRQRYAAKQEAKNAERAAKEQQQQAEAERKHRERIESLKAKVTGGAMISGEDLIDLARELGVDVHPRTVGMIRKRINEISAKSARVVGKSLSSNSVFEIYWQCQKQLEDNLTTS